MAPGQSPNTVYVFDRPGIPTLQSLALEWPVGVDAAAFAGIVKITAVRPAIRQTFDHDDIGHGRRDGVGDIVKGRFALTDGEQVAQGYLAGLDQLLVLEVQGRPPLAAASAAALAVGDGGAALAGFSVGHGFTPCFFLCESCN
jgi:hypothetical protein